MKKIFLGVILLTTTFSSPVLGKDCESFECKLNGIKRKNHINTLKGTPAKGPPAKGTPAKGPPVPNKKAVPEPTTILGLALAGGLGCYLRKRK